MKNLLILAIYAIPLLWLIKRDTASRDGISAALWIPTLWIGTLASRPLSMWVGFGGGADTLGGSPLDALFFFTMILLSLITLHRRGFLWGPLIAKNWPIFIFYGFLLISVVWANSPFASFKRWVKEFGNIAVALVILTEVNPLQAIRAVFVRCSYALFPLSIIFIRYFPEFGRRYSRSGGLEVTGVTTQKNSLGVLILVCGLIFLWDWFERSKEGAQRDRLHRKLSLMIAAIGVYLIYLSQSKTSMICLALGGLIIASVRMPLFRQRISSLGFYSIFALGLFFGLDQLFGLTETIVVSMGRDMTFTGRTDVWRELLSLDIDRTFGAGFMSLWDDRYYRDQLPDWVAFSAHNGYIEILLAGGVLGVTALGLMLLGTGVQINKALKIEGNYAVVRFAVFIVMLIANFSESNFACMTPLGFLFLLTAIGRAESRQAPEVALWHAGEKDGMYSVEVKVVDRP